MAEILESPPEGLPAGRGTGRHTAPRDLLAVPYEQRGLFEGDAADAGLGVARAMGYGFLVTSRPVGKIRVRLEPTGDKPLSIHSLLNTLNGQLKKHGAVLGVDSINRRLILAGPEGGR
jgi:hypothetical protein